MNNKKVISLIIGCMCVLLSYGICAQIKTINAIGTTTSSNETENGLRDSILRLKERYDNLYETLENAEKELETERTNATQNNTELQELESNITEGNKALGLTEVTGSGVIVTLKDNQSISQNNFLGDPNDLLVHYSDIIRVVNELKNAGAEAISINGQRIVANSVIDCDGSVIRVNGVKIGAPFEIKAIGLQETLVMVDRYGGYLWSMREEWLLEAELKRADNITIPKYSGVIKFEYAESE